ncbi:MAG TPA: PLP-dependent aminotransferase family protein [Trinickia sp.]|uniref:MocR-like pyridoxine biosynthesis transcription factor PdxR n=1 Tax=Trinickia sp. TaxID=2571163 RepID=UPI002BF2EA4D|nr:PLP-dependent aminotransferase family protein [Trinickia sp.]HVW53413.1 PLP-dependent aminotransferase family protein [Trinickia sp.]
MEPVFEFPLSLDKHGPQTLARRLHQQLRAAIVEQRLAAGTPLPSTRRVAQAYGVARNTVIAAYDLLMAEGFIVTRPGAAAEVADLAQWRQMAPRTRTRNRTRPAPAPAIDWRKAQSSEKPIGSTATAASARGFHLGLPDHRWFATDVWRRLLLRSSSFALPDAFDYPPAEGRPLLRAAIAQWVAYTRAVACTEQDVVVTSGAQQAFDLLARVLVAPGHTKVAIEDPGYPPLRAALLAAGAQLLPAPVDEYGLIVDTLPADVRIVCVTPSHQFPTGVAMSLARRQALLDFARRTGAVIIEDDYDGEFRYGSDPLDALQTLDREARVIYVGTFSKIMFPSLRVGYIVAPPWLIGALAAAKQCADNGGNVALQEALARFILDGHLAKHTRAMRKRYASRRDALLGVVERELGEWLIAVPPSAGIHLYARYRDRRQAKRIATLAAHHAAGAQPAGDFLLDRQRTFDSGIAFGFGYIDEAEIEGSIAQLARALQSR